MENKDNNSLSVEEGNKLIALFMGAEFERKKHPFEDRYTETFVFNGHPGNWRVEKNIKCHETAVQLMYHTDWDWLMPVVEKIESIDEEKGMIDPENSQNYHIFICKRYTRIIYNWNDYSIVVCGKDVKRLNDSFKDYRHSIFEHNKIKSTWQAVVDFIQWYNTHSL